MSEPIPLFVLHWNRPERCAQTVRAFVDQAYPLRVTVIDNGSRASEREALRSALPPGVGWIPLPANLGWGGAFNVVLDQWRRSSDEYCLLSAHDALPADGCVARLAAAMAADSRVGIACPEHGDESALEFSRWHGVRPRRVPRKPDGATTVMPSPHSTLVMFRRECIDAIGTFDARYFAYGDEADIGLRATERDWHCAMVWGARIHNPETSGPGPLLAYLMARNTLLLVQSHAGRRWAWLRLLAKALQGARDQQGWWPGARVFLARWRGLADFALGRFGRPPAHLFSDPTSAPGQARP